MITIILREDLSYNYKDILEIGLYSSELIHKKINKIDYLDLKYNSNKEFYMVFNLYFLYKVENYLIQNGYIFDFIIIDNIIKGIVIYSKEKIQYNFTVSLEDYSKHRLQMYYNLDIKEEREEEGEP